MGDEKNMTVEIQNIVTCINIYRGITIVNVYNLPNQTGSLCQMFESFSNRGVNIDMISITPSASPVISAAFTAETGNLENIFKAIGDLKKTHSQIRTEVSPGRCKVIFSGKEIANRAGTAAYIFKAFESCGIGIDLITTSHKEISCLISDTQMPAAKGMIEKYFGASYI